MPQLSAPPFWTLQQAVPSPTPSSHTRFPWRVKGSRPLLQKPSSLGDLRFPPPGERPLLPPVRMPSPTKLTPMMALQSVAKSILGNSAATSSFPRLSSPPPLTPPTLSTNPWATPPTSEPSSSPKKAMKTKLPSSSPAMLSQSPSPRPNKLVAPPPYPMRMWHSTRWDYYLQTQGMRINDPLYHETKLRKTTKKPLRYRLPLEELREIEQQVLAEMPTSGQMLTRSQLGKMQVLLRHWKGTK